MLKASLGNGNELCLLDFGEDRKAELRERSRADEFSCPICHTCLNVRLGKERIWHFAHRAGAPETCPLKHSDYAALETVATIYQWLKHKPAVESIEAEVFPEGWSCDRPIDLVFQAKGRTYIYQVVAKRLDAGQWRELMALQDRYILNFLFPYETVKTQEGRFLLNPNHRDSVQFTSARDSAIGCSSFRSTPGGYLHLVDWRRESVYKLVDMHRKGYGLREHSAKSEHIPLEFAAIRPQNGEIVIDQKDS